MFVKSNGAGLATGVALLAAYRPGGVVLIDSEDDEVFQEGASRFRRQQQLLEAREWFGESELVELPPAELAEFSPIFWISVRLWILITLIGALIVWYISGAHHMSNPPNTPPPAAAPAPAPGEPHGHTLQAQIKRFGNAVVSVATHPDNGMFFFDAPDLTVNDKLNTLKIRALIDTLCAAGVIERHRFESRFEELVAQAADRLEEGAKAIAFTARVRPGPINGGGH
jgi:hypothetical protein